MRRRPLPAFAAATDEPISALNTTPLIDVLLVLLIMFIITIPISTHKVRLDLLQAGDPPATEPLFHRLDMDPGGRSYWDGAPIAESALPALLAGAKKGDSELHFRADGETRYEDFDRVLAIVKRSGIERLGLIDNQRFVEAVRR